VLANDQARYRDLGTVPQTSFPTVNPVITTQSMTPCRVPITFSDLPMTIVKRGDRQLQ